MITAQKWQKLAIWMRSLGIQEADLTEKFVWGGVSGGKKINKPSSCFWIKHAPSGLIVKCQEGRSQEMNRYYARERLCEKLDFLFKKEKSAHQQQIEKIRRQKKRRTRKAKQKILADKAHQAVRKKTRRKPEAE